MSNHPSAKNGRCKAAATDPIKAAAKYIVSAMRSRMLTSVAPQMVAPGEIEYKLNRARLNIEAALQDIREKKQ